MFIQDCSLRQECHGRSIADHVSNIKLVDRWYHARSNSRRRSGLLELVGRFEMAEPYTAEISGFGEYNSKNAFHREAASHCTELMQDFNKYLLRNHTECFKLDDALYVPLETPQPFGEVTNIEYSIMLVFPLEQKPNFRVGPVGRKVHPVWGGHGYDIENFIRHMTNDILSGYARKLDPRLRVPPGYSTTSL